MQVLSSLYGADPTIWCRFFGKSSLPLSIPDSLLAIGFALAHSSLLKHMLCLYGSFDEAKLKPRRSIGKQLILTGKGKDAPKSRAREYQLSELSVEQQEPPSCMGGQATVPYEQNTQQSPAFGFKTQ